MKRTSPSLHLFAVSSSSSYAAMSSRPSFRGGRDRGRPWGRSQSRGRRSYSDPPFDKEGDYNQQFVCGDSHLQQVRDANQGFRPQFGRGSFKGFPHPPYFNCRTPYDNPSRPSPPPQQPLDQNQQHYRPPQPRSDLNRQFRPRWQHHHHQLRPRPPKALEYRNWEYASPGPPPECERFTILSYNILANYLVKDHWNKLYFHIPRYILDWERRKRSILFELGLWSADILCLQEVDRFQDLKEELELRGYNGIWKMRTGGPIDGCAIFWRNARFKLLHEESLEFCKLGLRDNVAQICVFESLDQCKTIDSSAPSTSSVRGNKLVICNIHALFNPKRGEIKLGQIRVLLHRAHAISKLWDDASVIICGDFNCTPKSPLYNFIAEQKLDLSELPRDKISGQASAEIHLPRPPYNRNFGATCADNSAQVLPASSNMKSINCNSLSNVQKPESHDDKSGNAPFPVGSSQLQCSVVMSVESGINRNHSEEKNDRPLGDSDFDVIDEGNSKSKSTYSISHNVLEESSSMLCGEASSSVSLVQDIVHDLTSPDSYCEDIHDEFTEDRHKENEYPSSTEIFYSSSKYTNSGGETESHVGNSPSNCILNDKYRGISSSDVPSTEPFNSVQSPNSSEVVQESSEDVLSPSAAHEKGFLLDEMVESLSLDEEIEGTKEDESTFLSELHGDPLLSHSAQLQGSKLEELNESFKECTDPSGRELDEMVNTPAVDSESIAAEKLKYDPRAWTPVEIKTATGNSDCMVMEHPIKLQSVYTEVQNYPATRDSTGEPAVTSYHRRFLGTVDYIWHSEGLQTARVLAPIPKDVMLFTQGFPTKKWGSDHIALVSELAFKKDISPKKAEVQLQSHA